MFLVLFLLPYYRKYRCKYTNNLRNNFLFTKVFHKNIGFFRFQCQKWIFRPLFNTLFIITELRSTNIQSLQKLLLWHRQSLRRVYRKPIYYNETVVSTIPQLLSQSYHCGCHSSTTAVVTIVPKLWEDCDNCCGTSVTIGIVTTVPT